jgi:dCMP deaminase
MSKLTKWDKRFMQLAKDVSEWSKDKNTKTGAVIVDDKENTELTMGYNGFPRGANDDDYPKRYERPDKYFWTEHAERNAIYKAARLGININGARMYCTYFPCSDCSRAIIQSGIKKLYTEKPDFNHHKWGESWVEALIMLKECGVEVIWTNEEDKCYNCDGEGYYWEETGHPTHNKSYKVNCYVCNK